jgi:glycosyltransferase involved in cell wall biosynthesis
MKLAFLNPSGELGGAELSMLDLMASIRTSAPDWDLGLILSADGPLVERARRLGVRTTVVRLSESLSRLGDSQSSRNGSFARRLAARSGLLSSAPAALSYSSRLRKELVAFAPDLVHSNGFKMHILGAVACKGKTPLVWHVRDFVSSRPVMALLLQWYANRCARAVAISEAVAQDLRSVAPKLKIETIYDGLDLDEFNPSGPSLDLDQLSGLPPAESGTLRVGLVATYAWWKGHRTFLRGLALLPKELSVRGYVIGGEIYKTSGSQHTLSELRAMAAELDIADRVAFTGFVPQPSAAIRALDIVIHASTEPEPFGRVIVEAMACGRPVITSGTGGAAELVNDEQNALLHRAGDPASLAKAIERLITQPELRQTLVQSGLETARVRFDRNRLASQIAACYSAASRSSAFASKSAETRHGS